MRKEEIPDFAEHLFLDEIYPERRLVTTPRIVAPGFAFSTIYLLSEGVTDEEKDVLAQIAEDRARFEVGAMKQLAEKIANINSEWNPEPWE